MPREGTESVVKGGESSGPRERTYEEMMRELWPQPDPEKERRQRKLEAIQTLAARMYDAFSSIGNMAATSKYAPHKHESAGERTHEMTERARQLREAAKSQWWNTYIQARGLDANAAAAKAAAEMAEREFGLKVEELGLKEKDLLIKAAEAQARGETEKARTLLLLADIAKKEEETKWVGKKAQAEINRDEAAAGASRASAANSYASAGSHNRSNRLEYTAWDENGKEYPFKTKDAADRFAEQHGTLGERDVTETSSTVTTEPGAGKRTKTKTSTNTKNTKRNYPKKPDKTDGGGKNGGKGSGKGGGKVGGGKNGGWASGLKI